MAKTPEEIKEDLAEWLVRKWFDYEERERRAKRLAPGKRIGSNEMAVVIGLPPNTWTRYMKRESIPDLPNIVRIAAFFGPEIYDILEVPRLQPRDQAFRELAEEWHDLDEDEKEAVLQNLREIKERKRALNPMRQGVLVDA